MRVILAAALFGTIACATNRSSTSAAATRDARFSGEAPLDMTMRGSGYTGTAMLTRQADSASGTFRVTGPGTVKGTIRGRISGSEITLDLTYDVAENGCKGTMRFAGVIAGTVAQGTAEAQDSCVGRMSGTFKLGR